MYIRLPEGLKRYDSNDAEMVALVDKNLYGLCQAGATWNKLVKEYLLKYGFKQLTTDQCIFVLMVGKSFLVLALYVDDVCLLSNDDQLRKEFVADVQKDRVPVETRD